MDIHQLTNQLFVSSQLTLEDINKLNRLGYQTIICNRPDGEQPEQPNAADLKQASEKLGMKFIYQPVINGQIKLNDGIQFISYIESNDTPVLAYCRTGTRSTILWALSQQNSLSARQIREKTLAAGYKIDESYITNTSD
ncbi:MAG: Beta-lactamase hydrolase-like protein [Candidatus Celerinatantimonas neptuna]|nr:MAG: Beta-lactamase hydrolase-like protein [Candidatus Celerinatantimonas neptuna]